MLDLIKNRFSAWLRASIKSQPVITENSSLEEISKLYPSALSFLEKKYRIKLNGSVIQLSLSQISKNYQLPPPQILFMEIQLHETPTPIEQLTAIEAQRWLESNPDARVLDVREHWEHSFGSLPRAQVLNESLFAELLAHWPKDTPILLYCHFGVRSLDAAYELAKNGFTNLSIIRGGIDAWSTHVDPTIPKYSGAYC